MIHRYLHEILTSGVTAIQTDLTLLEDLFLENYELKTEEVTAIKTYFSENPPLVVNGYAFKNATFPLIAIVLAQENEAINFLGDDGGFIEDEDDPYYRADVESAIWQHNYQILIYADNPDATSYLYEVVKTILLAGLRTLTGIGCFEYKMTGGDLAPDPRYLPEHLFARQMTFSCQREFQRTVRESRLQKAFKVSGIHIDKAGSPREVGDVKTKVTIVGENNGEEENE